MSTKLCPLQKFTVCQKQCAWLTEDNVCSMLQLAKVFSPPKSKPMTQEDQESLRQLLGRFKNYDNEVSKGSSRATPNNRSRDDFNMLNNNLFHAKEDCHHPSSHDTNCHDHHD
jgi:hypothetical protein